MLPNIKSLAFKYRHLLIKYDTAIKAIKSHPEEARLMYLQAKRAVEDFESDYEDDLHLIVEFSEKYLG